MDASILDDLKVLGASMETVASLNGISLYPTVIQKSVQPLVNAPFVPCCYGGGTACVQQGGTGTSHHLPGYAHPIPHISELGGRPEDTVKYPYKSKMEEFAATGKSAVVEAIEMPKVTVSMSNSDGVSVLSTPYMDPMKLKIPVGRSNANFQYGQSIKAGSLAGTYAGTNTSGLIFIQDLAQGLVPARTATPIEPVSPQLGPWRGLPKDTVLVAPLEIINLMKKSLQDSPYIPSSGYALKHQDYVDGLVNGGWMVFVVGGAVRDAIAGVVSKDIDIVTDAPYANMEHLVMKVVGGLTSNHFPYGALIQMGSDKQRALDITCLRSGQVWFSESQIVAGNISRDTIYRDFSCNALYYDTINHVIIDPTGRGIKDSVSKTLFPSCPKGEEEEWLKNPRLGLRFFKMLYKGYKPSPEILNLLTPARISSQCNQERGARGDSYFNKIGHWLLYRQICGDLYYGTGMGYYDAPTSVKKTYKSRMTTLKKKIVDNGYGDVWDNWVYPMLSKHIDI